MRVAALNLGRLEHECQLAAPEIARRFHSQRFRACEQVLAMPRPDGTDQIHHKWRKRYENMRAALLRIEIEIIALEAVNGQHRRVAIQ